MTSAFVPSADPAGAVARSGCARVGPGPPTYKRSRMTETAAAQRRQQVAVVTRRSEITVVDPAAGQPATLAGAMQGIAATMHQAVSGMSADDVSLEVDIRENSAHVRFRAYRRGG